MQMTTAPAGVEAVGIGRWAPVRCERGKRIADGNTTDRQVRLWCDRCKKHHTLDADTLALIHQTV